MVIPCINMGILNKVVVVVVVVVEIEEEKWTNE